MDNLVFEESINSEVDSSEFISKKWIYVNDSNSQNYTSQVVIDSTPLSNAGGYINWQEAYILMPLVVQLSCATSANLPATEATQALGQWSWAMKNSFIQMINSMNVEFNNQNIIQQTPLTNVFRSFKLMTSYSQNDLVNNGTNYGFYPDNVDGWEYIIGNSNAGTGLCNNNPSYARATLGADLSVLSENSGIYNRNGFWNYIPIASLNSQANVISALNCNTIYRSCQDVPDPLVAGVRSWRIYAKLRLKDLNEFFEKAPLLKGSTIRFYLNTNQTIVNFTVSGVSGSAVYTSVTPQVLGGLTNPLMLLPLKNTSTGFAQNDLPDGNYSLSLSIYKNTNNNNGQTDVKSALQACRLYAPVYKFNPIAEQRYLSLAPTKKIEYNDIFQYQFTKISAGEQFNFLVSNGIANIQSVLVTPLLSPSGNGTSYNTLLSPFSTTGGTPDPIPLTNFNILVSGVNLFLNNELYDFEQFTQQLDESNQLNGNLTTGLTSGLISEASFQNGMRYYYGNCARQLPSEMGVSRSIQIQGQNASLREINILVFVEFKRSITIDILTGARIE
jgi:hypothetical protein